MMHTKMLMLALVMAAASVFAQAAEPTVVETTDTINVPVFFRQGSAVYEASFKNNDASLDHFADRINGIQADTTASVHDLTVSAGASPEGSTAINDRLSRQRVSALSKEITRRLPSLSDVMVENAIGVDWEGLAKLIRKDPNVPAAADALDIIENTPIWVYNANGKIVDSRKNKLARLNGGKTWKYLYDNLFPTLRGSSVGLVCHITRIIQPEPEPVPEPEPAPEPEPEPVVCDSLSAEVIAEEPPVDDRRPFYMAVKTNMLYDVLAVPSIGVEFYLGKMWSAVANWEYGWWKCDHKHNYWRVYGGDIALRRWFGAAAKRKPLTGHHLGVYAQMVTYDFELGGRGYLAPRWSYAAGIEYGYSLPIARRFNIDFTAGIGYMGGTYKEYIPIDQCYVWQATKRRHWVGPTKLEISLVWLIGHGNVNVKK